MRINIEIDTVNDTTVDLVALFAALAGRMAPFPAGPAVVAVSTAADIDPKEAADRLIAHAAATRVVPPSGPAPDPSDLEDDETGDLPRIDKSGVPHDVRIHASPPSITKGDGCWRKKRKVDDDYFAQIHGELLRMQAAGNDPITGAGATGTANTGAASPQADSAPTQTAPPPPPSGDAAPLARPAPPPPPPTDGANAPTAAGSTSAVAASGASRFDGFASFVSAVGAIRSPTIPYDELNTYAQMVGVSGGFKDMRNHADKWDEFYDLASGQ